VVLNAPTSGTVIKTDLRQQMEAPNPRPTGAAVWPRARMRARILFITFATAIAAFAFVAGVALAALRALGTPSPGLFASAVACIFILLLTVFVAGTALRPPTGRLLASLAFIWENAVFLPLG